MAKDDYFVLAYRILSYLYACFKAGERPDMDCISADVLHIPVGYWFNIMRSLTEEGYIVGLVFLHPSVLLQASRLLISGSHKRASSSCRKTA